MNTLIPLAVLAVLLTACAVSHGQEPDKLKPDPRDTIEHWCPGGSGTVLLSDTPLFMPGQPDGFRWTRVILKAEGMPIPYTVIENPLPGAYYSHESGQRITRAIACVERL